jgi:hypothetical protein
MLVLLMIFVNGLLEYGNSIFPTCLRATLLYCHCEHLKGAGQSRWLNPKIQSLNKSKYQNSKLQAVLVIYNIMI